MAPKWYALGVHRRREEAARFDLARRGFDVFLPVAVRRRAWSDRVKTVEDPLFAGYLFVRTVLDAHVRRQLLAATATYDLVARLPGDQRIACPIADQEIEALQLACAAQRSLDPVDRLVPGADVVVASGPLRGARGVVERGADGQRRLVLQIRLLGRGARCVLAADDVLLEEGERVADVHAPAHLHA
jgi:transcription antitermination factor NusG